MSIGCLYVFTKPGTRAYCSAVTTSGLTVDLDRSSPVPLYFQLAQQLEHAIRSGTLAPGHRLDNELQLAERYGLSRPTMRRAIQELVDKGLVVRKRGVGTQVVRGQVNRRVELTSLYDDLQRDGQRPTTRLLSVSRAEPAPDDVASRLNLPRGTPAVRLVRLRSAGDQPLAIMRNWLPFEVAAFDDADLAVRGLYELMRANGVHMRIAQQRIGARPATAEEAALLAERPGAPLLTMERTTYDDSGHAVEFGTHAYRADRYSFEITLVDR
jgi:DNA-binding GntR family transcriptional regulator